MNSTQAAGDTIGERHGELDSGLVRFNGLADALTLRQQQPFGLGYTVADPCTREAERTGVQIEAYRIADEARSAG